MTGQKPGDTSPTLPHAVPERATCRTAEEFAAGHRLLNTPSTVQRRVVYTACTLELEPRRIAVNPTAFTTAGCSPSPVGRVREREYDFIFGTRRLARGAETARAVGTRSRCRAALVPERQPLAAGWRVSPTVSLAPNVRRPHRLWSGGEATALCAQSPLPLRMWKRERHRQGALPRGCREDAAAFAPLSIRAVQPGNSVTRVPSR